MPDARSLAVYRLITDGKKKPQVELGAFSHFDGLEKLLFYRRCHKCGFVLDDCAANICGVGI